MGQSHSRRLSNNHTKIREAIKELDDRLQRVVSVNSTSNVALVETQMRDIIKLLESMETTDDVLATKIYEDTTKVINTARDTIMMLDNDINSRNEADKAEMLDSISKILAKGETIENIQRQVSSDRTVRF